MNEPYVTHLPFLWPVVTALVEFAVPMFAVSWLAGTLVFVLPLFTDIGESLGRSGAYRHNPDAAVASNSTDRRRDDSRSAAIGAILLCHAVWFPYALVFVVLRLDHYVPRVEDGSLNNTMRGAVLIAGVAIYYAAYCLLLAQLARKLSPKDFAAVRVKWKAIHERWDG